MPGRLAERYTLSVEDNGHGFPKDVDFLKSSSLGLQIVNSLSQQLGRPEPAQRHPAHERMYGRRGKQGPCRTDSPVTRHEHGAAHYEYRQRHGEQDGLDGDHARRGEGIAKKGRHESHAGGRAQHDADPRAEPE